MCVRACVRAYVRVWGKAIRPWSGSSNLLHLTSWCSWMVLAGDCDWIRSSLKWELVSSPIDCMSDYAPAIAARSCSSLVRLVPELQGEPWDIAREKCSEKVQEWSVCECVWSCEGDHVKLTHSVRSGDQWSLRKPVCVTMHSKVSLDHTCRWIATSCICHYQC